MKTENFITLQDGVKISVDELKNRDLGIENIKLVVAMIISIIDTISSLVQKRINFFKLVRSLKTILPGIITLVKHGKTVLQEIKDLSTEDFNELEKFITEKSILGNTIEDTLSFLEWISKLKKR